MTSILKVGNSFNHICILSVYYLVRRVNSLCVDSCRCLR